MGAKRSRSASLSSSEAPDAPFSRETSADVKIVHLDSASAARNRSVVMKCSLPPHQTLSFASIEEYETHYQKSHVNRCSECQKNFPDQHFLHLHIAENHDPFNAAKRDRGEKTYQCLVPGCDRFCSTPFKRRLHCIDKHSFPRNYDFFIVNDGIDSRNSMLRRDHRRRSSIMSTTASGNDGNRRRSSTVGSTSITNAGDDMDVVNDEEEEDDAEDEQPTPKSPQRAPIKLHGRGGFMHPRGARGGRGRGRGRGRGIGNAIAPLAAIQASETSNDPMDSLASDMSALQFVPHSVRVARGARRGGA